MGIYIYISYEGLEGEGAVVTTKKRVGRVVGKEREGIGMGLRAHPHLAHGGTRSFISEFWTG